MAEIKEEKETAEEEKNGAEVNSNSSETETNEKNEEKENDNIKGDKKAKKELADLKKEFAAVKEKLEKAEKQNSEQTDKYLRLVAEYDNFRKRTSKEKESIYADAYTDVLKAMLPVVDNLERAVQYTDGEKVIEGVKMTLSQFSSALEKLGVEVIPTEKFDPKVHNAVMHVEDETKGEGEIVEIFQKGYKKGDKIIRYAMVKVAN